MKVVHNELIFLTGSFSVHNFTETFVDSSTFCSEDSVQNSKPEENFSIILGNKSKIVLPEDSFSKIPYRIDAATGGYSYSPRRKFILNECFESFKLYVL